MEKLFNIENKIVRVILENEGNYLVLMFILG